MPATILIVDDDPVQRRLLENHLNKMGHRCVHAADGDEALGILQDQRGKSITAVILDLVMPGRDGMGTLTEMKKLGLRCPVVVQTAQGGIDTVVSAMRAGAIDFCVKPVSHERLKVSLVNAMKFEAMEEAVRKTGRASSGTFTFEDMISSSPAMDKAVRLGRRAAASTIPVLIEGESGVGKEVLAKAIQGESERRGKPFVTVNCGALPENLAESLLFGHEKGAFTGATSSHTGKFKEADGGTLFLDEVGELSPEIQVKLLRAIQEGEIDPIGANKPVKTDFRLISATNRDMIELVREGRFREDLYYRLNVFPIMLPPLNKRREDIAALVRHFVARFCLEEGRRTITGVSPTAMKMLQSHDWPGNIRQLENAVFRAVVLCDGDELTVNEFPQIASITGIEEDDVSTQRLPSEQTESPAYNALPETELFGFLRAIGDDGTMRDMHDLEADMIRMAIEQCDGRMTRVARELGIGRSTLYRKLKEHDICVDPQDENAAA